jgi:hypothetical protein
VLSDYAEQRQHGDLARNARRRTTIRGGDDARGQLIVSERDAGGAQLEELEHRIHLFGQDRPRRAIDRAEDVRNRGAH